jgi:hypothetical protein
VLQTLHCRARFDRTQGVLMLGRRGRQAPRPLASVTAVEVVDEAAHQLNLVLDDPQPSRINLVTDPDAALVRRVAERLASFLGVPLLGVPQPAARGEAVNPLEELSRSPLPPGKASIRGPARVVPKGDDSLVLLPHARHVWARLMATSAARPDC